MGVCMQVFNVLKRQFQFMSEIVIRQKKLSEANSMAVEPKGSTVPV
jgi:hypothetical protein